MINVPAIFVPESTHTPVMYPVHKSSQWIEFIAQLSRLSDRDIPDTQTTLEQILQSDGDPAHRALIYAGIGRCQIREGKFLDGPKTLGTALSLVSDQDPDAQAFILIEMAVFLANIDQYEHSRNLLEKITGITENKYLLNLSQYYLLVQDSRTGNLDIIDELRESLIYFQNIGETSTVAYHHKNIGNIYRKFKEYDQADHHYNLAINIAEKNNFPHIVDAVKHDIGMLEHHRGNTMEALAILDQAQSASTSFYTRSFTLANMGFLLLNLDKPNDAAAHFEQSLDIATEEGVFHLIPGLSYYLGETYNRLGDQQKAHSHYQNGYQTSLELLSHHFTFSGDRKKAVEGYVNFLAADKTAASENKPDLSFAIDKSLKEIRGIFQSALINQFLEELGTNTAVINELGIADKTFYLIRDRVKPCPAVPQKLRFKILAGIQSQF